MPLWTFLCWTFYRYVSGSFTVPLLVIYECRSLVVQGDRAMRPVVWDISARRTTSSIITSNPSCLSIRSSQSASRDTAHFYAALTSRFIPGMIDSLNAEIALGTITSVQDAIQWLGYTYLFVRMRREPFIYGMPPENRFQVLADF